MVDLPSDIEPPAFQHPFIVYQNDTLVKRKGMVRAYKMPPTPPPGAHGAARCPARLSPKRESNRRGAEPQSSKRKSKGKAQRAKVNNPRF